MLTNLYIITQKKENFFTCKLHDEKHPIFQAHFPNNPLLPGFTLIDMCEKEFNHKIKKIKKISFLQKILPSQSLEFHLTQKGKLLHVEVKSAYKLKATLSYEA